MNDFIAYLDQFNVQSPSHANIYDEYTSHTGRYRLLIETKVESFLVKLYEEAPRSVIMTGNAGDGKTRLCRTVYERITGQVLEAWPRNGIVEASFPGGKLRIVKDLSELTEAVIAEELACLQQYILSEHSERIYYLIAANEGKLTKSLTQHEHLRVLSDDVEARFLAPAKNERQLHLVNLQDVTSSLYAERILEAWNDESNWEACETCVKRSGCVIQLNHRKMSQPAIREHLIEQYRLLDCLGVHLTMRELLIHISYSITGGLTCNDILTAGYHAIEEQSKRAYYDNFYGVVIQENIGTKEMGAIRHFSKLDPGQLSISAIDDFLLNGDMSGDPDIESRHAAIFDDEIDMLFGYYRKRIEVYRTMSQELDTRQLSELMPRLRRKFYFEAVEQDRDLRQKLVPYVYFYRFVDCLTDRRALEGARKELIQGLNHAFTKRLIDRSEMQLYAVNENLLIHDSYSTGQTRLSVDAERSDIDYQPSKFYLTVDREVTLEVRLPVFEYLLRLAGGGLFSALRQDVDILLATFRNQLINKSEPNEFYLQVFTIHPERGVYARHEIDI